MRAWATTAPVIEALTESPPRRMIRHLLPVLILCTALHSGDLAAQAVTNYRCTDAGGSLTVQNQPCPAGSQ